MMRISVALLAVAVAVATANCPPPQQQTPGCRNFCKIEAPGTVGKYYCCDEDTASSTSNQGSCPRIPLQPNEIAVMCDVNDSNRPYSLNCKSDADCFVFEKCCYTPHTQQRICRLASYE